MGERDERAGERGAHTRNRKKARWAVGPPHNPGDHSVGRPVARRKRRIDITPVLDGPSPRLLGRHLNKRGHHRLPPQAFHVWYAHWRLKWIVGHYTTVTFKNLSSK